MSSRLKPTRQDYMIGAIYTLGQKQRLGREALVALLLKHDTGLSETKARQLAEHWLGSYRAAERHAVKPILEAAAFAATMMTVLLIPALLGG